MKKYKLIKEYLGFSKLGFIITNKNVFIDAIKPQLYPEFWEEVAEEPKKDYEILTISFKRSDRPEIRNVQGYSDDYLEALLKCDNYIHSVKRLFDSEVFTVGDETEQGIIQSIEVTPDDLLIRTAKRWNYLELVKKIPVEKVLYITNDNFKITSNYRGQIHLVNKESFALKSAMINVADDVIRTYSDSSWIFHSFEKAKDFIIRNKPCLSLKEISQIYITANRYNPQNPTQGYGQDKKIYQFVQQKLNL